MRYILSLLFACACIILSAQNHQLQVDVKGFKADGIAYVMLYKEGQAFDIDSKTCIKKKVEIKNNNCSLNFSGLKTGNYAILVYHDENKNGLMDSNFIGMPKEGVGASNNQKGMPTFNKAKIILNDNKRISIAIKYLFE